MTEPDFFTRTERDLRDAVRRGAHLSWPARARRRLTALSGRSRGLAAILAALVIAAPALAAAGLFSTGAPVAPLGRPVATVGNGVVVRGGAVLTGLRVADPAGGPLWGLRLTRTTRGDVCLTVGRVVRGQLGALGINEAFGDDGRFHPFSTNFSNGVQCVPADADGHAFVADTWYADKTSAYEPARGGCVTAWTPPPQVRAIRRQLGLPALPHTTGPTCPAGAVRDVYFGLLGPDAIEIAYRTADHRLHIEKTAGPEGAYLVVERHDPHDEPSIGSAQSITNGTPIIGVAWHSGDNCGVLGAQNRGRPFFGCQIHDYVAPVTRTPGEAAVRSPLTVRRLRAGTVSVSFIARAAVRNARSHYAIQLTDPPHPDPGQRHMTGCGGAGTGTGTDADIHAGQRITLTIGPGLPCYGLTRGIVELVIEPEPQGARPFGIAMRHFGIGRIVGRFSYHVAPLRSTYLGNEGTVDAVSRGRAVERLGGVSRWRASQLLGLGALCGGDGGCGCVYGAI
jgi:hypothetical protein